MNKRPCLTISVVAKTEIFCITSACLTQALEDFRFSQQFSVKQSLCIGQSDLPKARSCQMTSWYDTAKEGDIFMFIDADQIFQSTDILRCITFAKQYDIACGAYPRKSGEMTGEPVDIRKFRREKEGHLLYGATGFMATTYESVTKMVKHFGKKIKTSRQDEAYPFFYERIVEEKGANMDGELWLGEDYSFCWLMRNLGGTVYGFISPTIGHILSYEKFISIPPEYKWPEKSITIYCAPTAEPWSPKSLEKGIGGSETAVILLTKLWVQKGYSVNVFCTCDSPGVYEGVTYQQLDAFRISDIFDILIVWRNPAVLNMYVVEARKIFLDLHDIITPSQISKNLLERVHKICVKSAYHKSLLGNVPDEKVAIIPNGGKVEEKKLEKDQNYLVYSSSYDRGLLNMLKWGWPKIKRECPEAILGIFYGWECYDKSHGKTNETIAFKKEMLELMSQDGIKHFGRVSQEKLLQEKAKANIHYYVGNFQEIDCISVRESASVGAIPIVSDSVEVFKEKNYCHRIMGDPNIKDTQELGADIVIDYIKNKAIADRDRRNFMEKIPDETWENIADKWQKEFV